MTRHRQVPRRYPRAARVNEVVREVLAETLERLSDPRLELVTLTGVELSRDLRVATVYYSAIVTNGSDPGIGDSTGDGGRRPGASGPKSAAAGLQAAAPPLRAALAREVRIKRLPELRFRADPAIEQGRRIDAVIQRLHTPEPGREP